MDAFTSRSSCDGIKHLRSLNFLFDSWILIYTAIVFFVAFNIVIKIIALLAKIAAVYVHIQHTYTAAIQDQR